VIRRLRAACYVVCSVITFSPSLIEVLWRLRMLESTMTITSHCTASRAGDGVGPELEAMCSRALPQIGRDPSHVPYSGARCGSP
jgi:hypothetical protein